MNTEPPRATVVTRGPARLQGERDEPEASRSRSSELEPRDATMTRRSQEQQGLLNACSLLPWAVASSRG